MARRSCKEKLLFCGQFWKINSRAVAIINLTENLKFIRMAV